MSESQRYTIREAHPSEYSELGRLMVDVYSQLEGFPGPDVQPEYFELLENIGRLTEKPSVKLFVAVNQQEQISGGVVYMGDINHYGSRGIEIQEENSAGFRLLAVDVSARGHKLGKRLSQACIDQAVKEEKDQLIIHSTSAMQLAQRMYTKMGFQRSEDLDFLVNDFPVIGFRLKLRE